MLMKIRATKQLKKLITESVKQAFLKENEVREEMFPGLNTEQIIQRLIAGMTDNISMGSTEEDNRESLMHVNKEAELGLHDEDMEKILVSAQARHDGYISQAKATRAKSSSSLKQELKEFIRRSIKEGF